MISQAWKRCHLRRCKPSSKAEYFLEDDGDQVLFKVADGLINGEYPVYYYAHVGLYDI